MFTYEKVFDVKHFKSEPFDLELFQLKHIVLEPFHTIDIVPKPCTNHKQ